MNLGRATNENVSLVTTGWSHFIPIANSNGRNIMWLKTMLQWLERQKLISQEQQAEELRAKRQNDELALRKAEVMPWYFPPPC